MRQLNQDQNEVDSVTQEVPVEDIIASSIQRIVNEILADIAYIFIREELFDYECEMILDSLKKKIRKKLPKKKQ